MINPATLQTITITAGCGGKTWLHHQTAAVNPTANSKRQRPDD
ncbi:hypothetical protein [Sporomusa ovata]